MSLLRSIKSDSSEIAHAFASSKSILDSACLGIALILTSPFVLGVIIVPPVSIVSYVIGHPDLSGVNELVPLLDIFIYSLIVGVAVVARILLLGLARHHPSAALWWIAMIFIAYTILINASLAVFGSTAASLILLLLIVMFVLEYISLRRRTRH